MTHTLRWKLLSTALLAVTLCALPALASPDWYGLGTGQDGSKTVMGEEHINQYTQVTKALSSGATSIPVASSTDFTPGRLVMVYQATGLTPKLSKSTAIDVSQEAVGRWELARLGDKVEWGVLHLDAPLVHSYAAGVTQVISVPEYKDLTVESEGVLTGASWNKATGTGGVLAFLATGKVTINGRVDMKAKGFPGGEYVAASGCSAEGQKGKGLAYEASKEASYIGRERWDNGGGGGVCDQSGGGGGGNGGMGGQGGNSATGKSVGGMGGEALEVGQGYDALTHLTLGGGGGAGHGTRVAAASEGRRGGSGGGIIFIRGQTLSVPGSISANGDDGQGTKVAATGGHGGGAGGSIYLRFTSEVECGPKAKLEARGGEGSHTLVDRKTYLGPGGGGGGGFARLQASSIKEGTDCSFNTSGGQAGQPENPPPGDDSRYGARGGSPGKTVSMDTGFPILPTPVVGSPANRIRDTRPSYQGAFNYDRAVNYDPTDSKLVLYLSDRSVQNLKEGEAPVGRFKPWRVESSRELESGSYEAHAVAFNTSEAVASPRSKDTRFTVDAAPPKVTVTSPKAGLRTREPLLVYEGTISDEGPGPLTVMVNVGGKLAEATVTGNTWRYTPKEPLTEGPHTVTVTAMDDVGNSATGSTTFTVYTTPPKVTVTSPKAGLRTREPLLVYEGTISEEGPGPLTVMVNVGGKLAEATVTGNTWRYTPEEPLPAGAHTVTATATNAVGLTGRDARAFTVDTHAAVEVTTPGKASRTRSTTPEFTGTVSDDGPGPLMVMVSVDGGPEEAVTVTGNTWSYAPSVPLAPGPHTVKATVTDDVGNTATDSNDFTVVDRDYAGHGLGCASSGGTPSALAMMGLAVLSALLARRRQR